MLRRRQAEIVIVGTFDEDGKPIEWEFGCCDGIYGICFTDRGILYAGYSVDELREIARADQIIH